jgi:hypothetical protein
LSTHYDIKRVMEIERNRPSKLVHSPQAKAWVLVLQFFLVLGIVN